MSDKPKENNSFSAGVNPGHFGRGGMGGMGMPVQKAKDFKGTIRRFLTLYESFRVYLSPCFYLPLC